MDNSHKKRINQILTIGTFLLFIFGLALASIIKPDKVFSANENRMLAQKPELTTEKIFSGEFSNGYESYITDQFVLRDQWILAKSLSELALMKKEIKGVYIGKDGYLIEEHSIDNEEQTNKNINRMTAFINKYSDILGEEHVKALLVPSAVQVLTDKLPAYAGSYDEDIIIDAVISKLKGKNRYIDVRDTLKEHAEEYIYYKTDHHYTTLGAYYVYKKWAQGVGIEPLTLSDLEIKKVSDDFYGTIHSKINLPVKADEMYTYTPKDLLDLSVVYDMDEKTRTDTLYELEHLDTKDKYSMYLDGNHPFVQITTGIKNGKRLLVIKDSFAHSLVPFLTAHFEEIIMVDFRYNRMPMSSVIEDYDITDILVLYNTMKFANDTKSLNFTK